MSISPKEIAFIISKCPEEIAKAAQNELPRKAAIIATNHFKNNFRLGGFTNNGNKTWATTVRQRYGSRYKPLTSGTDTLMRSFSSQVLPGTVIISNSQPYANYHNNGATITVTPRMKKFFWAKAYSIAGQKKGKDKGKKAKMSFDAMPPEAKMWMSLALTKKKTLKIPQRRFIGESYELNQKLREMIEKKLNELKEKAYGRTDH